MPFQKGNKLAKKHGLRNHSLYTVWSHIKSRCYNRMNKDFINYGHRGIHICEEWLNNFENFFYWSINNDYKQGLFIDRKDNNKNYEPSNCRWVTRSVNNNNKRKRIINIDGKSGNYNYWAKKLGCEPKRISLRLAAGWSERRAVTQPILPRGKGKTFGLCNR